MRSSLTRHHDYDVIAELETLKSEFPAKIECSYINDMILYARVGRDRKKLGPEWVESARQTLIGNQWMTAGPRPEGASNV